MKAKDALNAVPLTAWLALGVFGLIAFYVVKKGGVAQAAAGAVQAVGDAGAGAVVGVGKVVGIPETNSDKCGADLAAGNYWDASFSCPAPRFLSARFGGAESPVDQSIMDPRDAMAQRGTGAGVVTPQEPSTFEQQADAFFVWPPTLGYAP